MAWNEPGGGNRDQDPWGSKRKKNGGPPDLDDMVKKVKEKFKGFFGGGGGRGGEPSTGGGLNATTLTVIVVLVLVAWLATGFYIVQPAENAVVLRFGNPGKPIQIVDPGLHWRLPYPIESIERVEVGNLRRKEVKSEILTKDRNLIAIEMAIAYKVTSPELYLFHVRQPEDSFTQSVESALREVVGRKTFDELLGKEQGRQDLVIATRKQLEKILAQYDVGITITTVSLKGIEPPAAVSSAYVDANRAVNDAEAAVQQAEEYRGKLVTEADGYRLAINQAALAYQKVTEQKALGKSQAFLRLLREYEKAPDVTRKRMYLETMEELMGKVKKVIVKVKQGNSVMFLPLDRYMRDEDKTSATQDSKSK